MRPDPQACAAAHFDNHRSVSTDFSPISPQDTSANPITVRDITIHAAAAGRDPESTPVGEAMSANVAYVFYVIKEPVGIVATKGLATDTGDTKLSGEVLHNVPQG